MRIPLAKRIPAVGVVVLGAVVSSAGVASAVVPVMYPPQILDPIAINVDPGSQTEAHVSGDWAAYSAGDTTIRYYNFASGVDLAIAGGGSHDLLSDVSGSRIVFSRIFTGARIGVMVFDAASGAPAVELDAHDGTTRLGSAIGANTVAYIDLGLEPLNGGELVIRDLVTALPTRITFDTSYDQNPSVSADGRVVVWEKCPASSPSVCDIYQAVKTVDSWIIGPTTLSPDPEGNPDSSGTLVVYDSTRAGNSDIFWRPVGGGAEVQLEMPGAERNPSIAGGFIGFESTPTGTFTSDLFVYDVANNRLFQLTNTPAISETLSDLTVTGDGRLRMVWSSDEEGLNFKNVRGATIVLPNITGTLAYSPDNGYGTDGVSPQSGSPTTVFTYKVAYADQDDQPPSYMDACIDGSCHTMNPDATAAAPLRDGDFRNGEQYAYATTLSAGAHTYRFEAGDGIDTVRLPAAGTLAGPSVSGGAAQQVNGLIALVLSFNLQHGIENSLDVKLQFVLDAVNAANGGNTALACSKLNAFANEVQAQSGSHLTVAQADQLIAAANAVRAALGCP
jgi:hypothetical protein